MLTLLLKIFTKIKNIVYQFIYNVLSLVCNKELVVLLKSSTSYEYCNLYCIYNKIKEENCIFIDSNKISLINIFKVARSKILILDQTSRIVSNIKISKKTTIIQIWHSGGWYKKVGFNAARPGFNIDEELRRINRIHGQIDYFIISDKKLIQNYADAFHVERDNILPLGLARTDLLYQSDKEEIRKTFLKEHPEAEGKKILLYAPTFRSEQKGRNMATCCPDINKLKNAMGNEWCFVFKLHPTIVGKVHAKSEWIDLSYCKYEESLLIADVLVTDYSSILFDFSVLGKPVYLYLQDLENYKSTQRGLYITPEELVSKNNMAYSTDELILLLKKNNNNSSAIFNQYMSACDGKSLLRIVNFIYLKFRS